MSLKLRIELEYTLAPWLKAGLIYVRLGRWEWCREWDHYTEEERQLNMQRNRS